MNEDKVKGVGQKVKGTINEGVGKCNRGLTFRLAILNFIV